jgi:hypothetical protein
MAISAWRRSSRTSLGHLHYGRPERADTDRQAFMGKTRDRIRAFQRRRFSRDLSEVTFRFKEKKKCTYESFLAVDSKRDNITRRFAPMDSVGVGFEAFLGNATMTKGLGGCHQDWNCKSCQRDTEGAAACVRGRYILSRFLPILFTISYRITVRKRKEKKGGNTHN